MRNYYIISLIFLLLPCAVISQEIIENEPIRNNMSEYKKNSLYVEFGGNGFIYSLGYDRLFFSENKLRMSLSLGTSYSHFFHENEGSVFILPQINSLYGEKHNLELGIGFSWPIIRIALNQQDYNSMNLYFVFYRLGYRYQKKDGGLLLKFAFTPFTIIDPNPPWDYDFINPWLGVTIGWTF
jgi:hypothetical protein